MIGPFADATSCVLSAGAEGMSTEKPPSFDWNGPPGDWKASETSSTSAVKGIGRAPGCWGRG